MKSLLVASLICAGAVAGLTAYADTYVPRQYYSSWKRTPTGNYYYRFYYYKPAPNYSGYRHHYVIYYPQRPKYVYYYNPYKRVYWGRCPSHCGGQEQYSLLPENHRKGTLDEIQESAFPEPGPMPPIPESSDDAKVDLPPDDLPGEGTLPK